MKETHQPSVIYRSICMVLDLSKKKKKSRKENIKREIFEHWIFQDIKELSAF